jgi:OOP family OmpA-OmpF porin
MGKILKIRRASTFSEVLMITFGLAIATFLLLKFTPGIKVDFSKTLSAMSLDDTEIDNRMDVNFTPLPDGKTLGVTEKTINFGVYAWNAQSGFIAANGGPITVKGSFMDQNNVNVQIIKQDWLSELRNMQMKFVEEFDKGNQYPQSDKSTIGTIIMGDGAPFYISTAQSYLDKTYGKDKYNLQVVGAVGMSNGEDKVIGPLEWKTNPSSILGSLISVVPGDGDWVTLLNYCFINGFKVNPDFSTYDPDAVNIHPSANDDYIESAKELIASQLNGMTVPRKVVKDGKLTGETVNLPITGCATWTPGDKIVFDALTGYTDIASTKDFPNQMPTTLIVLKQWAEKHPDEMSSILRASYQASNQIKLYDEWAIFASQAVTKTYQLESATYWYEMFKGKTETKDGVPYSIGGSRVLNYADALQYYGITDGVNRYKSVYTQVSEYLVTMNPFDFNSSVDQVVPYDKAVNLTYLKSINDIDAGKVERIDYSSQRNEVMASGEWNINFTTNSDDIQSTSYSDLETIYNLLVQAEDTKLTIVGHTDNSGSSSINLPLSLKRAESVVKYLKEKGINQTRFQFVDGKGDSDPLVDNTSTNGKAKNRRVTITLLK